MATEEELRATFLAVLANKIPQLTTNYYAGKSYWEDYNDHLAIMQLLNATAKTITLFTALQTYFTATMTPTDTAIFHAWLKAANAEAGG